MTPCPKCLTDDCRVADRLAAYRRDPFQLLPLQNAMIACGIAASYCRTGAQPVTREMLVAIADEHERSGRVA